MPFGSPEGYQMLAGSVAYFFQVFFDFQGSHATGTGGSNGLAVAAVLHITTGEDPGDFREYILVRDDIAIGISVELAFENLRVGNVADAEKHGARREVPALPGLDVTQAKSGDFFLAD